MKRLIVCCDGTWQQLSSPCPTNVVKLAQAVMPVAHDGVHQIVYYSEGLGTGDKFDKLTGGAFGWGIDQAIQKAYRFLCLNYVEGDEVYLFGFSRGAYTVRSLAGLIYCSGLLKRHNICSVSSAYELYRDRDTKPSDAAAKQFRSEHGENIPITLLSCWDTVGELGVPDQVPLLPIDNWLNAKYKFHDTQLNRRIQNAFHAVAIDERRKVFDVTRMRISDGATTHLRQVWFPGVHGCVGGGSEANRGLSDATLQWVIDEVKQAGLGLDLDPALVQGGIKPDWTIAFDAKVKSIYQLTGIESRKILDPSDQSAVFDQAFFKSNIHLSTKRRWKSMSEHLYRPENLTEYKQWFDDFVEAVED
jgi:uncharacterized protein (DUF2235 family)